MHDRQLTAKCEDCQCVLTVKNNLTHLFMTNIKKEREVAALANGTVIDHIPSDVLFKVVNLLQLPSLHNNITIGNNLESKKIGAKGIIKIADKFFSEEEINRIAVVAPNIKINTIKHYNVVEKKDITLPDVIIDIVKCSNPKCITNNEPMKTKFNVLDKKHCTMKCVYCERVMEKKDIEIL